MKVIRFVIYISLILGSVMALLKHSNMNDNNVKTITKKSKSNSTLLKSNLQTNLLGILSQDGIARCMPINDIDEEGLAFGPGEELEFKVRYQWGALNTYVGSASLRIDTSVFNGISSYHCVLKGRTAKFFDPFFKVRENFQSWFMRKGLLPLRFTRNTREGKYRCKNDFLYSWENNEEHIIASVFSSKRGRKSLTLPITTCTYDLPTLFYIARNLDFSKVEKNVKYPLTFAIDDDIYTIYFTWKGREPMTIKRFGTIMTMKFKASLIAGEVFKGDEDLTLWVTDDDNRIPVYAESPIRVGRVYAELSDYSGLKHNFDSIIK